MTKKTNFVLFKLFAFFIVILFVATLFFVFYQSGFEFIDKDLGTIVLNDLLGATFALMLSGIIFSTISLGCFLISTFFGLLLKNFDQYLWEIAVFLLLLGFVLWVGGEVNFALTTEEFTKILNQTTFIGANIGIGALGLGSIAMTIVVISLFIKENKKSKNQNIIKNHDLENKIRIKQLNPKFRLFLAIFYNWILLLYIISWAVSFALISYLHEHFYIFLIALFSFLPFLLICQIFIIGTGIEYLPKDLREFYLQKNNLQLQKLKNLKINNVTQLFNVIPICDEVYSKKEPFVTRTKWEFTDLSWIEETQNRLVVNGKIDNLDFSWGIVTKAKKWSFKVFIFSVLCFGPIAGVFFGLIGPKSVNPKSGFWFWWGPEQYKKFGILDLFPAYVGKQNTENYLIFSAKLQNKTDLVVLTPKKNAQEVVNLDTQYECPTNISEIQKISLKNLMQEMQFRPSIYIYNDQISIVMKKYHYNDQDNRELQTWELIKDPEADSEIQFNYLNQAIKIYQIFNEKEE